MPELKYFDGTRVRRLNVQGIFDAPQRARATVAVGGAAYRPVRAQSAGAQMAQSVHEQSGRLKNRFREVSEAHTMVMPTDPGATTVVPTETVAIDQARSSDVRWLRQRFGMETVQEGRQGKVLMRVPMDADDGVRHAAEAALALHEHNGATAAPNFVRMVQRTPLADAVAGATPAALQWGLSNPGNPGVIGADVHARAGWTITSGSAEIRVAILDEGVDTAHPFLAPTIAAEADFVEGNATAMPDGDDAHGTACAGIVASRDDGVAGLARGVSLVAARIAKSSGQFWVYDDFDTADAIDWCWDDAAADVLSNSWGGGPPHPTVTRAIQRARSNGRNGKGAAVVFAAGNDARSSVSYPSSLPGVITVGASNQWDKRKTKTSEDGEHWWGTNYGRGLDVMAPGVKIATTDISGAAGYTGGNVVHTFNGTSAATPFVAAAAALILSVQPGLTEGEVTDLLRHTADPLTQKGGWSPQVGYGRVNSYAAIWAARR